MNCGATKKIENWCPVHFISLANRSTGQIAALQQTRQLDQACSMPRKAFAHHLSATRRKRPATGPQAMIIVNIRIQGALLPSQGIVMVSTV